MNSVIQLLEKIGSTASLQNNEYLKTYLHGLQIDNDIVDLIINKDIESLSKNLDVCTDIVCFLFPAEDDKAKEEEKDKEDETEIKSVING